MVLKEKLRMKDLSDGGCSKDRRRTERRRNVPLQLRTEGWKTAQLENIVTVE